MTGVRGGASAPPRPRDAHGRFRALNEEELLQQFLKRGRVRFPDPFGEGIFTIEQGTSMKNYPVRMFHSIYKGGAFHPCPAGFASYDYDREGKGLRWGYQLAISPETMYGWPGDKWAGSTSDWTVAGMAAILIHLAYSARLDQLRCGRTVKSGDKLSDDEDEEEEVYFPEDDEYGLDDEDEE